MQVNLNDELEVTLTKEGAEILNAHNLVVSCEKRHAFLLTHEGAKYKCRLETLISIFGERLFQLPSVIERDYEIIPGSHQKYA